MTSLLVHDFTTCSRLHNFKTSSQLQDFTSPHYLYHNYLTLLGIIFYQQNSLLAVLDKAGLHVFVSITGLVSSVDIGSGAACLTGGTGRGTRSSLQSFIKEFAWLLKHEIVPDPSPMIALKQ
ncbi:hypothetical protein Tco_1049571 [Tanacetum coccineum]